jgi:hypothetical protein
MNGRNRLGVILCPPPELRHGLMHETPKKLDQYALKKLAVTNKQRCLLDNETG